MDIECVDFDFLDLYFLPGIKFKTNNEPFKAEMQPFMMKIVNIKQQENLYASHGGPIILSQSLKMEEMDSEEKHLNELYYKQELRREMTLFKTLTIFDLCVDSKTFHMDHAALRLKIWFALLGSDLRPPDEVLRKGSGTLCEMLLMVQQVIEGLDHAVLSMKKGEVPMVIIPPEHAFGKYALFKLEKYARASKRYEMLIEYDSSFSEEEKKQSKTRCSRQIVEMARLYIGELKHTFILLIWIWQSWT